MKTNLDKFKANKELENNGVDFALDDKTSFRVRRFGPNNPKMKAAHAQYFKPYAYQLEKGLLADEKVKEINLRMFIDTCLVSWEGVEDEKGNPIEFSKEAAYDVLKDNSDIADALYKYSQEATNYRVEVGNS